MGPTEEDFKCIENLTDAIVCSCNEYSPHIAITAMTALLIKMAKYVDLPKDVFLQICDTGWENDELLNNETTH